MQNNGSERISFECLNSTSKHKTRQDTLCNQSLGKANTKHDTVCNQSGGKATKRVQPIGGGGIKQTEDMTRCVINGGDKPKTRYDTLCNQSGVKANDMTRCVTSRGGSKDKK